MRLLLASLLALSPVEGAAAPQGDFSGVVRLGGSTTLLPVIADCANAFMEKHSTWDRVDPSLPKKQILIFVTGGGSGFGIKAAASGAVDVGLSTRLLSDEEKAAVGEHGIHAVGKDCLAAVTNRASPFASREGIRRADALRVLLGEAKTWKELDPALPDSGIVLLIRDAAASANELLRDKVLEKKTFRPDAIQMPSHGAILKRLEENPNAFAFLSSGMAYGSEKLKVYSYDGVAPTNGNVLNGRYSLTRPMLLLVKGKAGPAQKAFIDFVLGPEGQKIVQAHGYVPAKGK